MGSSSRMMEAPPARWMAPSTPPPPASAEFAAFTMASAATRVISPTTSRNSFPRRNLRCMRRSSGWVQDHFAAATAHVHFVFDAFDGRPAVVPVDAEARGFAHAAEDLALEKRVNIVDGVNLHAAHLVPAYVQAGQPGGHETHDEASLFTQRVRRSFAAADDVVRIERAFGQFARAGNHERGRRTVRGDGYREAIDGGLG